MDPTIARLQAELELTQSQVRALADELEQTNRGVMALYVQLEQRDEKIRQVQRLVFRELEDALRPPPPVVAGVELAVHYLPAEPNSPTGGDLYDWVVLPDGSLHLAIVDVMGHGVQSTRDALHITHALRTLVFEGHPLNRLFAHANDLIEAQNPDVMATALVGRLHPRSGELLLAGAGHPPALVLDPNGGARYLEASGRGFGYPDAGSDEVVEVQLMPGEALMLYTDGLIESTRDVIAGLDRLAEVCGESGRTPTEQLPRHVVNEVLSEGHVDDTLAVAVRWTPS